VEIWKDIPNYSGEYRISSLGNVVSLPRKGTSKTPKMLIRKNDTSGYPAVCLCHGGRKSRKAVHRILAEVFIPNPNDKPEVNHIDGNKCNYALDNLEWVTKKENIQHAVSTGLHASGERNGSAKLTKEKAIDIRKLYASTKFTYKNLATLFCVSVSTIKDTVNRRYWNFV
jgi:hypothetical protein